MKVRCACRTGDHVDLQAAGAQASGSGCNLESTQQQLLTAGEWPLAWQTAGATHHMTSPALAMAQINM